MAERSKPLSTSSSFYRQSRVYMVMSGARRRNDSRLRSPWLKLRVSSAALSFRRPSNLSSCRKLRGACHCGIGETGGRLRRCRSLGHRRGHGRIAAPFRSRHPRRHDCLLDLSRIADRTADEPALDLTVVGRRVRKPALECVPLVARQRVADHSEPRIAWRGCAIGPIISNRRPSWSKRIFACAAVTSARSKNLSTVMQLLALKPARLSAFSGLPATRDAKANACQHLSRDRRRIAATRLIVCDGQEGGPEQSPEPSSREHWFCV